MLLDVPEGWKRSNLGDLIHLEYGKALSSRDRRDGAVPVFGSSGVVGFHDAAAAIGPSIVISRKGSLGGVFYVEKDFWPIDTTYFVVQKQTCDWHWLTYLLSFASLDRLNEATGVPGLNRDKALEVLVPVPPLHEQRQIAEILTNVDDAIAATRAVIEQTRKVRTAILAALFPTDLRVGPVTGSDRFDGWTVEPASEICSSIVDCKNRTPPTFDQGYAVVRTPNVRSGRFRPDGLQFTDRANFEVWTAKGLPGAGDILFTREAPYGEVCLAPDLDFCLGQRMMFLRPDLSRVSPEFLLYALQSGAVKQEMFRRAGGSTVGHLRVGDVRELPLPVAPKPIQIRVAETLGSLDQSLDENEASLKGMEALKSALMSDLLTGRKRVTDAMPIAAE